jgi:hypothetical protein
MMGFLCRMMGFICRMGFLCRMMGFICRMMGFLCRMMGFLCRELSNGEGLQTESGGLENVVKTKMSLFHCHLKSILHSSVLFSIHSSKVFSGSSSKYFFHPPATPCLMKLSPSAKTPLRMQNLTKSGNDKT